MMYAYIKGQLTQLFPTHVVETQGIGYEIQTQIHIGSNNFIIKQ